MNNLIPLPIRNGIIEVIKRRLPGILPISLPVAGAIVAGVGVATAVGVGAYRAYAIKQAVKRTIEMPTDEDLE